jgi:hypothetical protein
MAGHFARISSSVIGLFDLIWAEPNLKLLMLIPLMGCFYLGYIILLLQPVCQVGSIVKLTQLASIFKPQNFGDGDTYNQPGDRSGCDKFFFAFNSPCTFWA